MTLQEKADNLDLWLTMQAEASEHNTEYPVLDGNIYDLILDGCLALEALDKIRYDIRFEMAQSLESTPGLTRCLNKLNGYINEIEEIENP